MKESGKRKAFVFLIFLFLAGVFSLLKTAPVTNSQASTNNSGEIWSVRSVDTMKVSRDMARTELNNPSFDQTINQEVQSAVDLGANYIAIDTPYDSEFLPYLNRWVSSARNAGLKVWFRGSFSNYEGWFGYPKTMNPDQLLTATNNFIIKNPGLFQDGDIFDPCPECENGGYWPQTDKNNDYNQFMIQKNDLLRASFEKINKNVIYNWNSVIGGRAKDVLTKNTFDSLGNVIALDHYVSNPQNYADYINYFWDSFNTNVVFSEFGAPIPDIHGNMNEDQQAKFIQNVLENLYENSDHVDGINYWVLNGGTTALYNSDNTPRKVVQVIKDFYKPGVVKGTIRGIFNYPVKGARVFTTDNHSTLTDENGEYQIAIPAGETTLNTTAAGYQLQSQERKVIQGENEPVDFRLTSTWQSFFINFTSQFRNF